MATLHWNDEWGLGLADPDANRRELVGLYNEIDLALRRGDERQRLVAGLTRLLERAECIFEEEEEIMLVAGYPMWPEHRDEHRDFIQRMRTFEQALDEGRLQIDLPVMQFLKHWLSGHLDESDNAFGRFLARSPEALQAISLQPA